MKNVLLSGSGVSAHVGVAEWWCLDNPCGGSITGSFCSRSSYQYQCGAILPADVCVDAVHRLYVWYYTVVCRVHPGCQGASCCVTPFPFLCHRISVCLRGPLVAYVWAVQWRVLYGGFRYVFCLVLISCNITFHCSLSICTVWSILVNTCHSYVTRIVACVMWWLTRAALYLYYYNSLWANAQV